MSKFACVEKAPEELKKGELIIDMPTFLVEIKESTRLPGTVRKVTRNNDLRNALTYIGMKYMPGVYNSYRVPVSKYEGIEYADVEDFSKILMKIIKIHSPELIEAYLESAIKSRPLDVELIYFTGPWQQTGVFQKNGIVNFKETKNKKVTKV